MLLELHASQSSRAHESFITLLVSMRPNDDSSTVCLCATALPLILTWMQVTWDGQTDKENPLNWPLRQKWIIVSTVSMFTFLSAAASSIVAPAESQIARQLDIPSHLELNLVFSVFLLGYVIGPLVLAPLSE